jgi:hypothetical protein
MNYIQSQRGAVMKLSTQIKPISYLKAHAAEIVRKPSEKQEPLVITCEAKILSKLHLR